MATGWPNSVLLIDADKNTHMCNVVFSKVYFFISQQGYSMVISWNSCYLPAVCAKIFLEPQPQHFFFGIIQNADSAKLKKCFQLNRCFYIVFSKTILFLAKLTMRVAMGACLYGIFCCSARLNNRYNRKAHLACTQCYLPTTHLFPVLVTIYTLKTSYNIICVKAR